MLPQTMHNTEHNIHTMNQPFPQTVKEQFKWLLKKHGVAQDRVKWRALVNTVMNHQASIIGENFLVQLSDYHRLKKDSLHTNQPLNCTLLQCSI
jgi:hypothetical protein